MRFRSIGRRFVSVLSVVALLAAAAPFLAAQSADKVGQAFEKFAWRALGPAVMGGRTVDFAVAEGNASTIYAAVGPSGVWKSENNGVTWAPVFHKEATVSVGAIALAPSAPDIVWVGTGEATNRNSVTIGDGVYKSVDAGKTWAHMGLRDTRHISRVAVNRGDPNIVLVAAMGHLWGPNAERGVFRTIDGGRTWTKTLYINDNTGIADLAVDPFDSRIVYAAAYEHRRLPWIYTGGGAASGLYKSEDGGVTWRKLEKDLPAGVLGRIGIGVAPGKSGVVYALIEHREGGIWRSEDRGETWRRTCDPATFKRVNSRPFYYSRIHVDPADDQTIYVLSTGLFVSNDMGRKFRAIGTGIHPDHHGFWIDPANPRHLIDGNDGGIDISYDGGRNWLAVQSIDAAEVYQVGFDMRTPYWVTCGLQDNGSWAGPSATADGRGIVNEDWLSVGGGDGFFVKPDPEDPNIVYSNSQMGNISRYDLRIFRGKAIRPAARLTEAPYRFNWNTPILVSPHDSKTVYTAGNVLFRTSDGGQSWSVASPDLTTNDPAKMKDSGGPISGENSGAEMHCTIVTSPNPRPRRAFYGAAPTTDSFTSRATAGERGRTSWPPSPVSPGTPGAPGSRRPGSTPARRTPPSTATGRTITGPISIKRRITGRPGSPSRRTCRSAGSTSCARIRETGACSMPGRSSASTPAWTAERAGSRSGTTCRRSRCTISPSIPGTTISLSGRMAAESGSSTTCPSCRK